MVRALERGAGLAGCSAGVWVLGELAPESTATTLDSHGWVPGLRLLPGTVLAPHWDVLDSFIPGLQAHVESVVPERWTLVAIDDRTALVGDASRWQVFGFGTVMVRRARRRWRFRPGDSFHFTDLTPAD